MENVDFCHGRSGGGTLFSHLMLLSPARRFSCTILLGLACFAVPAFAATHIDANDTRFTIMGRTLETDDGVLMAYPAVTLRFRYRGPAPTVHFKASNADSSFNLSCNGWAPVTIRLNEGDNAIALPTGSAPEDGWVIEFVRRNETWMGTTIFEGITLPEGGRLLAALPLPERKILLLGDSAACGEFIERFPPEDLDSHPRTINAGRSFGMLLGKWLNAQSHIVAYGGRGVVTDWAGRTETNNAPQFFPLANGDDPTALWDHDRYQPDVILIHLGIADFLVPTVVDEDYIMAWDALLDQVRAAHPDSPILITESVGLSEEPGTPRRAMRDQLKRCLLRVVEKRHEKGDPKVSFTPLGHYPGTPADPHPVAFQHEQIALELMPAVKAATGW